MKNECLIGEHGNCQHIGGSEELWVIPTGAHYFFGHSVSVPGEKP